MITTVIYFNAPPKYLKFCLLPLFAVLFREYGYKISCYLKVTLGNKTNGGDMRLFRFSLRRNFS